MFILITAINYIPASVSRIYYEYNFITEPTAAPMRVQGYLLNTTTVFLSWSPPLTKDQNGIIQHYNIEVTNIISGRQEVITTIATHFLFKNLEPNSSYSFTVAAYTVALGPASQPIVVNTESDINMLSGNELQCINIQHSESEIKGAPTAALGALTGVFAVLTIVFGIASGILACFYHNIKKGTRYKLELVC